MTDRLLRIALRERMTIALAALSLCTLALTQLYLTWIIKEWVERALVTRDLAALGSLLGRASTAAFVGMVSLFVSRYSLAAANQRLVQTLRNDAASAILRAPVHVVRERAAGEWLSRLFHDVNVLSTFLSTVARRVGSETIILAGALVMMFVLDWRLALGAVIVVPIAGVLLVQMGRRIRRWGTDAQESTAALTATISEELHGFTTIKTFQAERAMLGRVRMESEALRRRVMRGELWSASLISLVFLIAGAAFIGTVVWGTLRFDWSAAGQATFLAFCLYAGQTIEPARRLSEVHGLLQQSLAAAERVFAVIDLAPETTEIREERPVITIPEDAAVTFSNVAFAYEQPLLRDLAFAIGSGEMVGLAGASGCGKSTIARLIVRFLDPHAGRIEVFGRTDRSTADLRSMVCVVEQDAFVFRGTILDNLLLGDPSATREQAALAAHMCGIAQDLDFVVREAGRDLSGGEKQRVALARAVLRDPHLLILDEATSSLDGEAEAAMFTALSPWLRQRTLIAVSHRLSTMRRFPRVLVLEKGRVAADGDPERLLHESSLFRALFADQIARPARTA